MCFSDTNHEWGGSHLSTTTGRWTASSRRTTASRARSSPTPAMSLRDGERASGLVRRARPPVLLRAREDLRDRRPLLLLAARPDVAEPRLPLSPATSFGYTANTFANIDAFRSRERRRIFDELDKRDINWSSTVGRPSRHHHRARPPAPRSCRARRPHQVDDFFRDAADGTLPPVAFVDATSARRGPRRQRRASAGRHPARPAVHERPRRRALQEPAVEQARALHHVRRARRHLRPRPSAEGLSARTTRPPLDEDEAQASPARSIATACACPSSSCLAVREARLRLARRRTTTRASCASSRRSISCPRSPRATRTRIPIDLFDFQSPPNLDIPALPEATVDPAEKQYCDQTFAK